MSILLKGGKVVNADASVFADVLIRNGIIEEVGTNISVDESVRVIDVTNKIVVPGGIDPHTHFNLPFMGSYSVDNFESGSKAALAGGTTTVIDFAIPNQGESLLAAFDKWTEWAKLSYCDFSFHSAVTWWSDQVSQEMGVIVERGVNSFKHFLAYKLNDEMMCNSFARAKELGCIVTCHAEHGELLAKEQQRILKLGITGPEGHPLSRPPEIEAEATNRAIVVAHTINVPVYIVHCSCKDSLFYIERARKNGWVAFGEALAGHLTIDDSVYFDGRSWEEAAAYVMSPPFRSKEHLAALWEGLAKGDLQTTATDNCTFCAEQKALGRNDFTKIPNGCNGVEDRMSIVYDEGVLGGKINENQYVAVTSTNAAKIFNMYPRKGVIAKGSDADITIIDPNVKRTISKDTQFLVNGHNVWEGRTVSGVTVMTISQGKVVWEANVVDGVAQWNKGQLFLDGVKGRFISRPAFGFPYEGIKDRPLVAVTRK